jgi:superfamily II DNA or RNA helicase
VEKRAVGRKMSAVYATRHFSPALRDRAVKAFTYTPKTKNKGVLVEGAPLAGFALHPSGQWVAFPKAAAQRTLASVPSVDYTARHVACPGMAFTGTLMETPERDQQTATREALAHLEAHGGTLLALRTGFGKTVCASYLITQRRLRALVLVCREPLLKQWVKELSTTTNAQVALRVPDERTEVLVCTPGTLCHVPESWILGVGTLVLDEAVDFCTEGRIPPVLRVHPQWTIACTATPTRPDGLHVFLTDVVGSHAVLRSNTTPFQVTKLLTGVKPAVVMTKDGVNWTALQYELFFSCQRNHCLVETLVSAVREGKKVLVLTAYTAHVDLLMRLLADASVDASRYDGALKSYRNARVLVGNTKKLGIGFDEKSHCTDFDGERINLLVLACSTKQFETLQQYVGRVVGRAQMPEVIHLVDEDPRVKGSHWRVAQTWYEANEGTVGTHLWKERPTDAWEERHGAHARAVLDALLEAKAEDDTDLSHLLSLRQRLNA